MSAHVSKCKNDNIKGEKKKKSLFSLLFSVSSLSPSFHLPARKESSILFPSGGCDVQGTFLEVLEAKKESLKDLAPSSWISQLPEP
jgi:hypothetical protein